MVKRDTIQRYAAIVTKDEMGGDVVQLKPAEIVDANVSINATFGEITQYGLKNEMNSFTAVINIPAVYLN